MKRENFKVEPVFIEVTDKLLQTLYDNAQVAREDHLPMEARWYTTEHLRPYIGRDKQLKHIAGTSPDVLLALIRHIWSLYDAQKEEQRRS